MKRIILCALLWACTLPCAAAAFRDKADNKLLAGELVTSLSGEELLSQLFFLGYQGRAPSERLLAWIAKRGLGGVKIFTRNSAGLDALAGDIHTMQSRAAATRFAIPLFVATDQEGGWVRHIKEETLVTPGNLALAATGSPSDAWHTGYYLGRELALIGINMNYAPDVDVYSNPENSGIGPRAFSSDPVQTGLFSLAYFRGMREAGILCAAKHYPGHGDAELDSHGFLPEVDIDFSVMWERELLPYRFLIREGLPAIMTGHIAYPRITGDKAPATLSPFFCTEVLRGRLGFTGVLLTDSLEMWGVRTGTASLALVAERALLAGNDMILIAHDERKQEAVWVHLAGLLKSDKRFAARVRESALRILALKLAYFKGDKPPVLFPAAGSVVTQIRALQEEEAGAFAFQTACRSVTLLRGRAIPYNRAKGEKLLLLAQYRSFLNAGLARYPGAGCHEFPFDPMHRAPREVLAQAAELVRGYDTVIFCLANLNSLEVLQSLKKSGKKIIVISTLTPVYLDKAPWVESALAVYGFGELSFKAGFAALAGDFAPTGKLPLKFD